MKMVTKTINKTHYEVIPVYYANGVMEKGTPYISKATTEKKAVKESGIKGATIVKKVVEGAAVYGIPLGTFLDEGEELVKPINGYVTRTIYTEQVVFGVFDVTTGKQVGDDLVLTNPTKREINRIIKEHNTDSEVVVQKDAVRINKLYGMPLDKFVSLAKVVAEE